MVLFHQLVRQRPGRESMDTQPVNPSYLSAKQRLSKYPANVREFASKQLASETRGDITKALRNRSDHVPRLAMQYRVTEAAIEQALDVLEIIRMV
jgi:hypothetical protein